MAALILAAVALILHAASARVTGTPYLTENIRILEVNAEVTKLDDALAAFETSSDTRQGYSASHQPEGPFWVELTLSGTAVSGDLAVEFRMLRTRAPQFWSVRATPEGGREVRQLEAKMEKGGTTAWLTLDRSESVSIVGLIDPLGVARPKVFVWNTEQYVESERLFERGGGTLIGSFLMLALFSVIVGAVNRDWSFFLFAGWLITSLRVASINDGWDLAWLGVDWSNEAVLVFLRLSLAAHALLTVGLFRSLLETELKSLNLDRAFAFVLGGVIIVLCLGFVLPHRQFLPILWLTSASGIVFILISLGLIIAKTRTSVSMWYASSWAITFSGVLTEVAYAAGFSARSLPGLNAQTASIASALITAVALAERLRKERSARLAAQKEAVSILKQFKENYNSMPIGLFSVDPRGYVTLSNPAFKSMFSLQEESEAAPSKSIHLDAFLGPHAFSKMFAAALASGGSDVELQVTNSDMASRWFLARVKRDSESIEGSIQDITARKAAEDQLQHLVDHDHLTGLLNRRGIESRIAQAIDAVRAGHPCSIAYVDLDRFKIINDLHGHGIGDALLSQAAKRLNAAIRSRDCAGRIADGFVVLFFDCPDHALLGLTERLREAIGDGPFEIHGKALSMTASIGVVSFEPTMSVVDAMAAADRACAEAKSRGRNCVVRLTEQDSVLRMHLEELRVVADLQQHVSTERYFLEFQPIVALQSAASSLNYEVLIRMRGERGEIIPPGKFIGAAERNGLMSQIDRWVLRSTLEWLDDHPQHRDILSFATINISGASLNDNRFVDDAFSMIAEHPMAMPKLCFEITESVALHDLGSTRRFVDRVRMYGSKLALDDFGAGYTSFNYLKEIPADFIKIDGSFVKDINRNPANFAITRTIVELTHELGMRSIAEWAETPDTIAALIELGVDYGQGFGLVRPIAPSLVSDSQNCLALVPDPLIVQMLRDRAQSTVAPHSRIKLRPLESR